MSVKVKYKGEEILSLNTDGEEALATQGQYCEADIIIENTQDGDAGGDYDIEVVDDGNGGQILNITDAEGGGGGGGVKADYSFSVSNSRIEEFVDEVIYTSDYSTSQVGNYTSHSDSGRPNGQTIPSGGNLRLYNVGRFNEQTNDGKIYNIQPNTIGGYEIVNGNNVNACGKLTVSGGVRVIYGASFTNLRDLGGWTCDGGTVKYGLLYRGREMDAESATPISAADKQMLTNLLGIDSELDMREVGEGGGNSLFTDYLSQPIGNYADIFNTSATKAQFKTAIEFVMKHAIEGKPIYYHCAAGADRTGTVSWMLLALLGVSQSDCDKEYEITAFTTARYRTQYLGALYNAVMALGEDSFFGNILKAFKGFGVDIQLVNQFRHAMINGSVTDVAYPEFEPIEVDVTDLKCCTRMNWEASSSGAISEILVTANGKLACAVTTPNEFAYTDRESNTVYAMPVPNGCTKVTITTTDNKIQLYRYIGLKTNGTTYTRVFEDVNVASNVCDFSGKDIDYICVNLIYSLDDLTKPDWNYNSTQVAVKFTNY